jgi:hypothetical protein
VRYGHGTTGTENVNRSQDAALLFARLLFAVLLLPGGINKLLHSRVGICEGRSIRQGCGGPQCHDRDDWANSAYLRPLATTDGPRSYRAHSCDHVVDVWVGNIRSGFQAAAADPFDQKPRRVRGSPVLCSERTRGLESDWLTSSLVGAHSLAGRFRSAT